MNFANLKSPEILTFCCQVCKIPTSVLFKATRSASFFLPWCSYKDLHNAGRKKPLPDALPDFRNSTLKHLYRPRESLQLFPALVLKHRFPPTENSKILRFRSYTLNIGFYIYPSAVDLLPLRKRTFIPLLMNPHKIQSE